MKPSIYSFFILVFFSFWGNAQSDQKVFLITLDGYRWQELFSGADSLLIQNRDYVDNSEALYREFWRPSAAERREVLNPFIWNKVAQMGQIHGNRTLGSKVNLTNYMWFSYPGYNEILTGRADDERISSNAKQPNPNITVLEQFAQETAKTNKVAAFGSWDVFDFIVNEQRSGVYTNSGFDLSTDYPLSSDEQLLNELQPVIPSPWGSVRLDGFTHQYAKAYLKKHHPDLIYISYGETDDFAHDGDYAAYLKSAHNTDKLIEDLWDFVQNDPYYKDATTFLITTDHGRGTDPLDTWKGHGTQIKGADQTWLILFGKQVDPLGEIDGDVQLYTNQVTPTVRQLLGLPQLVGKGYGSPLELN
ncbi:MAG: phosphoglyceromutase [Flavobacteriaceae bacterium]|nr:phosphoglyceromutase [Flavobacteriaceae bacterium]